MTEELIENLKPKLHFCYFQVMNTIALNKAGEVVDEIHVMVNVKDNKKYKNAGKQDFYCFISF